MTVECHSTWQADGHSSRIPRSTLLLILMEVPHGNCCPAEGVPFDTGSHPVTAAMSAAGLAAYPDRAALERTLAPLAGERAAARDQATQRACARAAALAGKAAGRGG